MISLNSIFPRLHCHFLSAENFEVSMSEVLSVRKQLLIDGFMREQCNIYHFEIPVDIQRFIYDFHGIAVLSKFNQTVDITNIKTHFKFNAN